MATIGKCLLFYLKHPAEMERLYEADPPRAVGLPNATEVLEKVKLVGDVASKEGAELLEQCAPAIESHFHPISMVQRKRSRLEWTWNLGFRVAPKKSPSSIFEIGVSINATPPALIPWLWLRGGRRAEDEVVRLLNCGIRSNALGWYAGSVALQQIPIAVPDRFDLPLEADALVNKVAESFALFTVQLVERIATVGAKDAEE